MLHLKARRKTMKLKRNGFQLGLPLSTHNEAPLPSWLCHQWYIHDTIDLISHFSQFVNAIGTWWLAREVRA